MFDLTSSFRSLTNFDLPMVRSARRAGLLTETNRVVNELLNDKMITDLTTSVANFKDLTAQATTTLEKAEKLIDSSKNDIDTMLWLLTDATNNFNKLAININGVVADEKFKPAMFETADAIAKLSKQLTPIIGSVDSKEFAEDLTSLLGNLNEISTSVNQMTKDEHLKTKISDSIDNLNITLQELFNPSDKKKKEKYMTTMMKN